MSRPAPFLAAAAAAMAAACATPQHRSFPLVAPLPPLPRSAVAAVLMYRDELALSDDQVQRLEDIDARRQRLVGEVGVPRGERRPPEGQGEGGEENPGGRSGGGRGGGWGGHGGGRGGGMGGYGRHGGSGGGVPEEERAARIVKYWDDHDTNAYLEAETLLTDAQRPRAREIAEKFRTDLSAQRETYRKEHP